MPNDRIQIVKADPPAKNTDVGMQRKYEVPSKITPGHADISHHAYKSAARNQNPVNMPPHLLDLEQKRLVILNMAQLVGVFIVAF